MTINEKLNILKLIATKFNQANISWAVGGSLLLYFEKITDHFNDLDIMIANKDAL